MARWSIQVVMLDDHFSARLCPRLHVIERAAGKAIENSFHFDGVRSAQKEHLPAK